MHLLKRLATLLALALTLGLIGCSSLTLAYNQMPLLGGLWMDSYLDLDSAQRGRLKDGLRADIALDGGVRADRLTVTVLPDLAAPLLGMDVLGRLHFSQKPGELRIEPKE